jgi:hypothetical protein
MDQLQPGVNLTHAMPPNPPVMTSNSSNISGSSYTGTPNMDKLRALGAKLSTDFKTYENHRKLQELKWQRNLMQFLGEYDNDVAKTLDANRSKAYPRLTRVKVISMLSRLMNLLFPVNEKNWGLAASPVPNLSMEDMMTVLQQAQTGAQQAGGQLSDTAIEAAVRAFAMERAKNLEREVEDQLAEVGGNRNLDYVALCRKVLFSGILYGAGVLKGPFVRQQLQRTWARGIAGAYVPQQMMAYRPQLQFVPIWDYYPDMTAKHMHQMDGQFQRMVLSKSQLRALADRPDFFGEEVQEYLSQNPKGNWKERTHETMLRTIGTQSNVNVLSSTKYEVIIWDGFVSAQDLRSAGIEVPDEMTNDLVDASVWTLDNRVIKCLMSPWAELEPDERVQMYHQFIFEEDDSSIIGNGLPNIMRDSQMNMAAATRMLMDNASVVCGPNLEINTALLRTDQDIKGIQPYKIWYREDDNMSTAQFPSVREVKFDSHIKELQGVVEMCQAFADAETFVNPATGGDMQKGPSEPFRTAAGASMIQGQAALPFKDVVRNYDTFTMSVINSIVLFNKHFNPNREVQGDFTVIARGSSSLIAKEVRGMALDMLAQTVQPEERKYIDWYKMVKERLGVRDVDISEVLLDADAAKAAEQAESDKQAADEQSMKSLMAAEVRKLLADATKSLTAADSNSASAEAKSAQAQVSTYEAVLRGLESGVTPKDVHAAHQGADVPPAIAAGFRRTSGKDKPVTNGTGTTQ